MRFAFYTVCPSPHQYPLAEELASRIGAENFRYISLRETEGERARLGWGGALCAEWEILPGEQQATVCEWLENADVLFTSIRDIALFERRAQNRRKTFYFSERWFKPISVKMRWVSLPGWMRMVVPRYGMMVRRFVRWANEDPLARVFPIGPWAAADFRKMGVCSKKLVPWGYFVSPGVEKRRRCRKTGDLLRVLWAGRDIPLKHVRDIEAAVALANRNLKSALHSDMTPVVFTKVTNVPILEVRRAMREHDVFVFSSNGFEGWGAVVSEALEEGMNVIGTWECGAPPTLLPKERLYHCGDVRALARLLELEFEGLRLKEEGRSPLLPPCSIGEWTAKAAAERLMKMVEQTSENSKALL